MPALEENGQVVVTTWSLDSIDDVREFQDAMFDLGLSALVRRLPKHPVPDLQINVQVDIPSQPDTPIIVDKYGTRIRVIRFDTTLLSWEKLPDAAAAAAGEATDA